MSEYINKSDLYKEIAKLEKLARDRYLDTPIESPVFVRYQSQLNERTNLKHLIADFPAFDFDRLRELTQADKEGRCLVLPCKVRKKPAKCKAGYCQSNGAEYSYVVETKYHCPACGVVVSEYTDFCPLCRQLLEWNKEEEDE